jgi:uncharacterized YccA/Bax inhibitor family protein
MNRANLCNLVGGLLLLLVIVTIVGVWNGLLPLPPLATVIIMIVGVLGGLLLFPIDR